MEARVTAHSQAFRLRERMAQAEVQHGQEIRADLPGIKVTATAPWLGLRQGGKAEVFFCNMGAIRVRKVAISGDGKPLPDVAVVQGLDVAGDGTYDLVNALVRSNGNLRVIVDEATQVVRSPRSGERRPEVSAPTSPFAGTVG